MKKIKFLALIMLAGALVFTSCKKDDEETATALPTITFQNGNNSLEFTGTENIDVNIDFTAEAKVSTFKLTFLGDSLIDKTDDYKGKTSGTWRFERSSTEINADIAASSDGTVKYVFTLVDKDNNTKSAIYTVTTPAQAGAIKSYTAVLMGAQSNNAGSYYDVSENNVYTQDNADANPELIDFVHYYGSTHKSTVCAPNDATVNGGSGNLDLYTNWATKNATLYGVVTGVDFSAITDDTEIVAHKSDATASITDQLAVGTVVEFKTVDGKFGMFKVTAVETDDSGSITIDVKVQE